ncbi:TetR family transcriptional regulator C-terminal domain-containing protein [Novosphingobium sp.]|uniref:TetR/AcrR family transcriptional regulator n=1 Tax=Novosphingobium sp. TaxID=1874826 RepID=UPI0025FB6F3A|nr:TetR family transcriptional regulator C-terminal domain-containing protein [Novosphingobium sp.]
MDRNTVMLDEAHREAGIASDDGMATGPRPGTYARGTETVDAILKAAHDVLIEEGASAFTIRRIATKSGMKVGNVSYHFPRKEMLIKIMLDELLDSYDKLLENEVRQPEIPPEDRLRLMVKLCLDDIAGKRTTRLFTELWALANHNAFVADRVRVFYQRVHDFIGEVVTELNPALSPDEVHTVALYISASMEGSTPFLGFEKPWAAKMPQITAIAAEALVALAKSITPQQIAAST